MRGGAPPWIPHFTTNRLADQIPLVFPNAVGNLLHPKEFDRQTRYEIWSEVSIPGTFNVYALRHHKGITELQPASP